MRASMSGARFGPGVFVLSSVFAVAAPAEEPAADPPLARVTEVRTVGSSGSYLFQVTVRSPDRGCDQYADWWEVVTPEGELLYRRILRHSHVAEQPFTRSGGPVAISEDREVIVRAHMNPAGYGGGALRGSAADGFVAADLAPDFGADLEQVPPKPDSCAF